jgi:para-aminobenzoate synthetase / 4-amino-4-deoxychorismate lyase
MSAPPHADPGKGVFETMLVLDGRPVELAAHLARLGASLEALFAAELPGDAPATVLSAARELRHGKLRLTVAPGKAAGPLQANVSATEIEPAQVFPAPERGVALRSLLVPGGLGAHKWADRRLLERAEAVAPDELPLLIDADGAVLEAARGSVFSVGEGRLTTPPTDGRILPSIARAQALKVARAEGIAARESRLTLDDLCRGGLFLAGSVRGIEPVRTLDGVELPPPGEISSLIAAGLRRRWLRVPQGESVAVVAGGRRAGPPAR